MAMSCERSTMRPNATHYSPGRRSRKLRPSCLRIPEKTTHLAGMLTPCRNIRGQLRAPHRRKQVETDHGERLGCEENLDESSSEEKLDNLDRDGSTGIRRKGELENGHSPP